jgi:short-subunit dehydrogenase
LSRRKVALITGASRGIGAELARVFAAHGHDLALTARDGDQLRALAVELTAAGAPPPIVILADLAAPDGATQVAAALAAADAEVQILVNNAGYGLAGEVGANDPANALGTVDLNIRALLALTLALLPQIRANRGRILNVASIVAFFPGPGMAIYYASKAFVRSFSLALWQEERRHGVGVTMLCPGLTPTGFQARAGLPAVPAPKFAPDAHGVAAQGYAALMAGRRTVVPGLLNKIATLVLPLLPDAIVLPLVAAAQKRRR